MNCVREDLGEDLSEASEWLLGRGCIVDDAREEMLRRLYIKNEEAERNTQQLSDFETDAIRVN